MQFIKLKNEPSYQAIHEAFDYQQRATEFIKQLEYAAIFHEQGLGKSKIAIDLALTWLAEEELDTLLVVTKKALVKNWENEFRIHSHLNPKVLTGDSTHDGSVLLSPARIIICHYELIKKFEATIRMFCNTRTVGVFLDESQKIKNPDSTLTKAFFRLSTSFEKRVILTGTPIANRPYDIWAQIYFLDRGKSLGTHFNDFKRQFNLSNNMATDEASQSSFIDALQSLPPKLSSFIIRETKLGCKINLPPKRYVYVQSDWEPRQWDLYNDIKHEFRTYIKKDGRIIEESADGVLKRILRLQQICSIPSVLDQDYKLRPGKLNDLDEILEIISSKEEKAIIWTQFTGTADYLHKYLQNMGSRKLTGKMSIDERNKSIRDFISENKIKWLVATYGAAKEGLTLTVANNAIFFDRSLSLDDYLQSQDRIHRISQEKECNLYVLEMNDSIESWVDQLLSAKMYSAGLALTDISQEDYLGLMSFEFGSELKRTLGEENV